MLRRWSSVANVLHSATDLSQLGATVYASEARTATPDTQEFELIGDVDEFILSINVTDVADTGQLDVKVEGVDRLADATFPLGATTTAHITEAGEYTIMVGPSLPSEATGNNTSFNAVVPKVIRVTATHGNSVSLTYSVELQLS